MRYLDWLWADAVASLLVSLLILRAATALLRRAAHILLEGVPDGIDLDELARSVERAVPVVRDVHHVHVWQLTGGSRIATLHAVLAGDSPDAAIREVRELLHARYAIDHVTVQLDGVACAPRCPHESDPA